VGSTGNLYGEMALAGMAGRAVGGTASLGSGTDRIRATSRESSKAARTAASGTVTESPVNQIAAELRDLASRAQSLLAKLHDSGLMSDEEVIEQKRRFLGY
jgi:hypothetical protein